MKDGTIDLFIEKPYPNWLAASKGQRTNWSIWKKNE